MPIYEYRCDNGHLIERFQRMSDAPLETCDECGAGLRKVLSAVAIHFKGSGFHNTDYGRGKAAKAEGVAESKSSSDGASGSSGATTSGSDSGSSSTKSSSSDSSSSSSTSTSSGGTKAD